MDVAAWRASPVAAQATRHACSALAHSEPWYCAPSYLGVVPASLHIAIARATGLFGWRTWACQAARSGGSSNMWGCLASGAAARAVGATAVAATRTVAI